LSGETLNRAGYWIVLDEDPEEAGVYAVNDGKICSSKSFALMSEYSSLYYLKTEQLTSSQFGKTSGYELWHRRLEHCSNRNIRDTIHHSSGLECLMHKKFEPHMKCPSCVIGKSTLEDLSKLKDRATEPLYQVNMDSFSSSVTSIRVEGYNYAVVFADYNSGYIWVYGMKLKSQEWHVEDCQEMVQDIADLRQKHKLVIVRENAGENKSQEIIDSFESVGMQNYFSTAQCAWAMAEWTRRSRNQFDHDDRKEYHGGIWTGRSILVQGSISVRLHIFSENSLFSEIFSK
jgi:hypothetical protein